MEKTLYAFWSYDLFPGCLGGIVEDFRGEYVRVKGYGGHTFKPFKIVEGDAGAKLLTELRELSSQRQDDLEYLEKSYRAKRDALITLPK